MSSPSTPDEDVKVKTLRGKIEVVMNDELLVAADALCRVDDDSSLLPRHAQLVGDWVLQVADAVKNPPENNMFGGKH